MRVYRFLDNSFLKGLRKLIFPIHKFLATLQTYRTQFCEVSTSQNYTLKEKCKSWFIKHLFQTRSSHHEKCLLTGIRKYFFL